MTTVTNTNTEILAMILFFENLVWEYVDNYIVILDIPDHHPGPNGLKEGLEKLFQTVLVCIMITSGFSLEYFLRVNLHSKQFSWLRSVLGKFRELK